MTTIDIGLPRRSRRVGTYLGRVLAFRRASFARYPRLARAHRVSLALAPLIFAALFSLTQQQAAAQTSPIPSLPVAVPSVTTPSVPGAAGSTQSGAASTSDSGSGASIDVNLPDVQGKPSQSVLIIIGLTLLSLAPTLLIMLTSFTRMVIVLSLTRNAVGLPSIPPNQVVVGLAIFLSLFVMGPTLSKMNSEGLQPLLRGEKSQSEAFQDASAPIKQFMLANTRKAELALMIDTAKQEKPDNPEDVSLTTLIPAFILSELKTAFIIGFIVFIPFLVIDLVVSAVLMSLGMMMLPPALVALPFKLLLFVMVDGWSLVAQSLVRSFRGTG